MATQYKITATVPTQKAAQSVINALLPLDVKFTSYTVKDNSVTHVHDHPIAAQPGAIKRAKANGVTIRKLRPQIRRVMGGAKTNETGIGKSIMSVFVNGVSTATRTQIVRKVHKDGWRSDGDTYIANLVKEGLLVRAGFGIYRLPTTQESLQQMQARDPSFHAG